MLVLYYRGDIIKKIVLLILFLIPIYLSSFNKTTFFNIENKEDLKVNYNTTKIVYLKDKGLYLDLDDYLLGVISAEMPALFNIEALKAQTVASRSFILSDNDDMLLITTTGAQAYQDLYELKNKWNNNYNKYLSKMKMAIKETKGEVVKRDNRILKTYYFSMSNGYTENSQTVFKQNLFKSVKSNEDRNTKYTVSLSLTDFKNKLNINNVKINEIKRNETNHVDYIIIDNQKISGIDFRKKLNLRSTDFNISINDNLVSIETNGYGHGVGMSQYGANSMAKNGSNYKEILEYYYQNINILKINV